VSGKLSPIFITVKSLGSISELSYSNNNETEILLVSSQYLGVLALTLYINIKLSRNFATAVRYVAVKALEL